MPKLLNKTNLPNYASAPSSPANGDIYYNTTDHKVYARQNGAWVDLSSGGGSGNIIYYQSAEPTTGTYAAGDLWIDSDDYIVGSGSIVDSVTSTSTTAAASANAAKLAYDTAASSGNTLLNGAFDIWQRGTSYSSAGYIADRWFTAAASGQTFAASQQTFTPATAPVAGYEGTYFLRCAWSGTPSGYYWLSQRVEDVRTFAGQTVTLSFWAKASSSTSALSMMIEQNFGTGGSSVVGTNGSAMSITTSWQRFSQTFSIPSISGKTIGTNSYLDVRLLYGGNSVNGINIDIWGAQLESGSVATAFQRATKTIASEFLACYRYYYRITPGVSSGLFCPGYINGAASATFIFTYPVTMRTTPSLETSGTASHYEILFWNTATSLEASRTFSGIPTISSSESNTYTARLNGSPSSLSGASQGYACIMRSSNTTAYLGFSAEF